MIRRLREGDGQWVVAGAGSSNTAAMRFKLSPMRKAERIKRGGFHAVPLGDELSGTPNNEDDVP